MGISLKNLQQDEVRKVIPFEAEDGIDFIVIKNPFGSTKQQIMNFIEGKVKQAEGQSEIELEYDDVLAYFIRLLTNIDIDETMDIDAILSMPKPELVKVMNEISEIVHEVVFEVLTRQNSQLNALEKAMFGAKVGQRLGAISEEAGIDLIGDKADEENINIEEKIEE